MIAYLSFPHLLFQIDTLYSKFLNFRYFSAGIELSVRVNGTKFHYGKLMISAIPNFINGLWDVTSTKPSPYMNLYSASSCPHMLVSPTENVVEKLVIPFTLPKLVDLAQLTSSTTAVRNSESLASEIAGVRIFVLNSLRAGADATDVGYTVFARFVDVHVSGYM